MRVLPDIRQVVAEVANVLSGRESEFSCGDCERTDRCGLPRSDRCVVRAQQIERNGGRSKKRDKRMLIF